MPKAPINKFTQSVKGKVIIAFVVASLSLFLAWETSKIAFDEILSTVESISKPTERLRLVNKLSLKVVRLEQLQRTQTLNQQIDRKQSAKELKELSLIVDTLNNLYRGDTIQLQRLASLNVLLKERDRLFTNYLKERQGFLNSESIARQLQSINDLVEENTRKTDSAIVESEKRTLTTTIYELEEKKEAEPVRGFFNKLFGKRKTEPANPGYNIINEELNVKFDTVALARQDSILRDVGESMRSIEKTQKIKSERLLNREALLIYTSDLLINRMLSILRQVESEAVEQIDRRTYEAKDVVNKGIRGISIIILVFVLLTIILLTLILSDISKNNLYREQLEIAKDEAEYHGMAKQRFLSSMSHEIRTPLQSIIGYSEIIKSQDKPDEKYVDAIFRSSKHLMQIVNEVLDYNRIVSGKFTFTPVVFNMLALLEEVISVMKLQAERKGIKLYSDFDFDEVSLVEGDAFRLKQILYNLIGNAIKFTAKGHVALNVSCKKQADNLHFMFIVEDTGIGFSAEDAKYIFNEFERIENPEKQDLNREGAGLGLPITRLLVEGQGGRINFRSKLGEGSSFTIYLKYKGAANYLLQDADIKAKAKPFEGKVWMVDDDPFIVDLCSFILSRNKIAHRCFYSPQELLDATWEEQVQYILTDIRMPGISGTELCQRLRTFVPTRVKIFALTAQVLPEEQQRILSSGFDGILIKPFREKELLEVLGLNVTAQEEEVLQLDYASLEQMTFGDRAQLEKLLKQFKEECRTDIAELNQLASHKNLHKIALVVHRLAGRIGQFGGKKLAEKLRALEYRLNQSRVFTEEHEAELKKIIEQIENLK